MSRERAKPKNPRSCAVCLIVHDGGTPGTYVAPAPIWSKDTDTKYLCGCKCYEIWRLNNEDFYAR